ncbi:hypothetical protein CA54_16310 [Symmachiella macrocystis]|uniref:Type II toxin-antitoxin system ParD family antitoxin n=1 Tax=Symmachiella macrocystis TaxID=2527985 RepID=A0A5C6BNC5_9PLAN|nr:type II toxin-antitoxin system ParD family antitoxin [Symmachiella macrocystis]TWU12806.1 hypothetical protein CA54_16310 [Symmachiella macrocystis]
MGESLQLPHDLQDLVNEELATGRYASSEDVLKAAVQLLREQDRCFEEFRVEVQSRMKSLENGNAIKLEDESALSGFFDDIRSRGRQRRSMDKDG